MTNGAQNKIKQIRERLGLSQTEFADKIGITKGYLSAIESGKRKPGRKIFEGIIQECLEDLVAVYSGKPSVDSAESPAVAEPGPQWRRVSSSMELSRQEEALVDTLRFLGAEYAKDLYYRVMSRARKAIQRRELEKGELEKLKEVLSILGKAAIDD
jgi:transcriptional regulator with XRE-family HTH domain